ncbi:hypothetical protein BJ912DRAFT_930200 [Pholiota molesta]|nr:hypothetical protein BJ912DRAFT_930200 [Pholiota molesta]
MRFSSLTIVGSQQCSNASDATTSAFNGDSRKDKENKFAELPVAGPSTRSVVWAAENTIHSLGTPLKHVSISSKHRPGISKSILKVSPTNTLLQLPPAAPARETTPEPSTPLWTSTTSIAQCSRSCEWSGRRGRSGTAYSRLRACVTESTDADASWPIFQPLRKNAQAFADAVVRDVKRALVDPLSRHSKTEEENALKLPIYALPSPASSPLKKKGGLSEEQVKYARDLSTTCLSVIKLLGVVLSIPAVYRVFEEKQLADILTAVLAIPLADELPTPNARKTSAPRIAYALRRGMDGELGKEGKKGSANDALRAIHDLCVYLPAVFIPAFTPLLPSVLANLLAPTLALRTQACHALGGFVNGSIAIPVSTVHTKISNTVSAYITTASPSPGKASAKSPNKPAELPLSEALCRNQGQPHHLHPPRLWSAHAKSSLRALTCAVWRQITWAYFQPPLPIEDGEESEVDEDSYMRSKQARLAHCKVIALRRGVPGGRGDDRGAARGRDRAGEEPLRIAVDILLSMTAKAGQTCQEGVEALHQMTSGAPQAEPFRVEAAGAGEAVLGEPGAADGGVAQLGAAGEGDLRPAAGGAGYSESYEGGDGAGVGVQGDDDGVADVAGVSGDGGPGGVSYPKLNLLPNKAAAKPTLVAAAAAAALADPAPGSDDTVPDYNTPRTQACTNGELRMRLVRHMWATGETLLARLMQGEGALVRGAGGEDDAAAAEAQARAVWVGLCVDVVRVCGEPEGVRVFWRCEEEGGARPAATARSADWGRENTGAVWKAFVERWREAEGGWEGGVVLLGVPFTDRHTWGLASEDYSLWEELLQYTTGKALDLGIDSTVVLDKVSSFVSSFQTPGASPASGLRLIDLLLSNIDAPEMRELPTSILEHTSETMRAMYPLEPRFRQFGMWMIRSLTTVVEHCPRELALGLLQAVEDGLCVWLADARGVWTEHELTYDIVPLYQHIVLKIQVLPESLDTLTATGTIMDSIFRHRTPAPAVESFTDFWNLIYARMAPPAGGWPAPIRHCLGAVGILPTQNELTQDVAVTAPLSPLAPAFLVQPSSPRTPISSSFSTPPTAIVRREALSRVQSPQRPQKIFGAFPIMPFYTALARQPAACERWRVLSDTPSKRRRLMSADADADDKENALCAGKIPSVAERIAGLNVAGGRKRRYEEVEEAGEEEMPMPKTLRGKMKPRSKPVAKNPVAKKPRLASPAPSAASASSNESEDERTVEAELTAAVRFPSVQTEGEDGFFSVQRADVPQRTRGKGLRAIVASKAAQQAAPSEREHTQSLGSRAQSTAGQVQVRKIDLSKMSLRRSTSIPEALLSSVSGRKRKHGGSDEGEGSNKRAPITHPVAGVRIGPPRHAKRSFSLPSSDSDLGCTQPMSSDDDPHYGQVTPHNIISPAPSRRPGSFGGRNASSSRRYVSQPVFRELFGDEDDLPGSDDSVGGASSVSGSESDAESPTKKFETRQLHRSGSSDALLKFASSSGSLTA